MSEETIPLQKGEKGSPSGTLQSSTVTKTKKIIYTCLYITLPSCARSCAQTNYKQRLRWNPASTEANGNRGRISLSTFCKRVLTFINVHLDGLQSPLRNNCLIQNQVFFQMKQIQDNPKGKIPYYYRTLHDHSQSAILKAL